MSRIGLLALVLTLAACDGGDGGGVTFGGERLEGLGDASLAVAAGELVVSGLEGTRTGGFALPRAVTQLDVRTAPVDVPPGGFFGVRLDAADGETLARFVHEADAGGVGRLRFQMPAGVTHVRVTYRRAGQVVFTIPRLPLTLTGGRRAAESTAGETEGESGSVHVRRNADGRYVLVNDAGSTARGGPDDCAGFVIRPPVALPLTQFPDGRLCSDWVEVLPLDGPVAAPARVAVTARGVGTMRVRSLEAQ